MHGAQTLLGDGDTGWHLRTGEWILAHGRVPDRDIFSFTRSGQPWFAWEWLWDVLFGWLHLHAGMAAVVLASSLVLALTFALLFRMARRSSDALVALALTLVAAAGSAGHWLARPHLFTMLFTVIFYSILERTSRESGVPRRLWLLPPLMVLWTNLHGGFFVGILLIAAYAAGQFAVLLRETGGDERRQALRRGRRYLLTAAGCGVATFVNPYGYRLHAHIFAYLADGFYRGNIMEFQSLNFQSGQARYFEILLAAGAAAAFVRLRRGRLVWPLLFAYGRIWRSTPPATWRSSCCWRPLRRLKWCRKACGKCRPCAWPGGCGAGCGAWRTSPRNGTPSMAGRVGTRLAPRRCWRWRRWFMLRGRPPPSAPLTIPNPFRWPPRANWRRPASTAASSRKIFGAGT
jgi:hypothetical protein